MKNDLKISRKRNLGYGVVSCEGGYQVGKADAILNLRNELSKKNISVTYSSFPVYATPLGTTIRRVLKNGFDDSGMTSMEKIGVKMSLYSLNRLEFLDALLSSPEYLETLLVLDRSSFSSALSVAYAICSDPNITMKDADQLVDLALELDSFMVEKLQLKNCVIELVSSSSEWDNIRSSKKDMHENKDVQLLGNEIYKIYAKKIGKGWRQVVTKNDNGWRDRSEILNDIMKNITDSFGKIEKNKNFKNMEVGIEEIMNDMYKDSVVDEEELKIYKKSLHENDKDTMYEYACNLGDSIASSCKRVEFHNLDVKHAFKKIVEKYPRIFDVVSDAVGENYVKRLQEALK